MSYLDIPEVRAIILLMKTLRAIERRYKLNMIPIKLVLKNSLNSF
jgi:hypothetical protein